MTVATEAAYAERQYTGIETLFTPGFSALDPADVLVGYLDISGLPVQLTLGVHYSSALDPSTSAVTITRIAFPSASADAPVTIYIQRNTPATQGVDFTNLAQYDPSVHQEIADSGAMRDAELKGEFARNQQPFNASSTAVDFRPRVVKAADPVSPEDLATKAYADLVSGSDAAGQAAISAAAALVSQNASAASATSASGSAASASASAAILSNPDYGFVADAPTQTRDYGTIP